MSTIDLKGAESTTLTTSNDDQLEYRNRLWQLFKESPMSEPELERSLGLFIRGSLLARILAFGDIYRRIVGLPGYVFDLGTWRGQNAVLCENYRSIYEPFNKQRKVLCFDTFEGYKNWSDRDRPSKNYRESTYSTGPEYAAYLEELLRVHEGSNALGHIRGNHRVIPGDATKTVPEYLSATPSALVSLALFDLGLYEPTRAVVRALLPHTVPGSVFVFLQLTRDELPGDAIAFKECFAGVQYTVEKCQIYPTFSIVTIR